MPAPEAMVQAHLVATRPTTPVAPTERARLGAVHARPVPHPTFTRWLLTFVVWLVIGCDPIPQCFQPQDCSDGRSCQSGQCVAPCTASSDCEKNEECQGQFDPEANTWIVPLACQPSERCGCSDAETACVRLGDALACINSSSSCSFGTCSPDFKCRSLLSTPACTCAEGDCGPTCTSNAECLDGLSCKNGRCQAAECTPTEGCKGGKTCVIDPSASSCRSPGQLAKDESCTSSDDCASGFCASLATGASCQTPCIQDDDCRKNERCALDSRYDNKLGTCVADDACAEPQLPRIVASVLECASNQSCSVDANCPSPATCSAGLCTCPTGQCSQSCDDDSACADGLLCTKGACALPQPCSGNDDCGSELTCTRATQRLGAGKYCLPSGLVQSAQPCTASRQCQSGLCVEGRCADVCGESADCSNVSCTQRTLADAALFVCGPDDCGCAADEVCLRDKRCVPASLCIDAAAACPDEDQECVSGVCQQRCTTKRDCADDAQCVWLAAESGFFCMSADECNCSDDEVCEDGFCLKPALCTDGSKCEDGSFCLDGLCRKECSANAECDGLRCLSTVFDGQARRLCSPVDCECPGEAWCDRSQGSVRCFWGNNCDDDCAGPAFTCSPSPNADLQAGAESIAEACTCVDPLTCGIQCSNDDDCASGTLCSQRKTCAPPGVCATSNDCAATEECVVATIGALPTDQLLRGQCQAKLCNCTQTDDLCVTTGPDFYCVQPQSPCSVLDDACGAGYRCVTPINRCACDDPESCGGGCQSSADCDAARVCESGRCVSKACSAGCPKGTVCGGPNGTQCVQPGGSEDYQACTTWQQCASGYCFANNTCATPCSMNSDCPSDRQCQQYEPGLFPGQSPICLATSSCGGETCAAEQYCNTTGDPICQPSVGQ